MGLPESKINCYGVRYVVARNFHFYRLYLARVSLKRTLPLVFGLLFAAYCLLALKERRWNPLAIEDHPAYAPKDSSSFLQSTSICISDLIPITRRTYDREFCSQLNIYQHQTFQIEDIQRSNKAVLNALQVKLQEKIYKSQNPADCSKRKLLVCDVSSGPGFGSLMHLLTECFLVALRTNRTMVVDLFGLWFGDMENIFKPIASPECTKRKLTTAVEWRGYDSHPDDEVVKITIFETSKLNEAKFDPFSMPKSIADPLQCNHGSPHAWWIGQIVKYFMRLQPRVAEEISKTKQKIGFSHPIVGLHIRRTDKSIEDAVQYQYLETYMALAVKWYDCYFIKKKINVTKKIYLATDNPNVINEAKTKYPDFEFLSDPFAADHSSYWWNRYSENGMMGLLIDAKLLSECDFFIGTYSSNLGRVVYERRQADGDKTYDSISLDWSYGYHRGYMLNHIAVQNHTPLEGEMELQVGDKILIHVRKTTLNQGYGLNLRTNIFGFYPAKKVRELVKDAFSPDSMIP